MSLIMCIITFLHVFCCQQISQKKLKKFEKEYHTIREQQEQQEAPIERYEVDINTRYLHEYVKPKKINYFSMNVT